MNDQRTDRGTLQLAMILGGSAVVCSVILIGGFWLVMSRESRRLENAIHDMRQQTTSSIQSMTQTLNTSIHQASQNTKVQIYAPDAIKIRGINDDGAVITNVHLLK